MKDHEIFEIAREHMLRQGFRSVNERGKPAYRGINGGKDPICAMLPDELYNPVMEGMNIYFILSNFPKVREFFGLVLDSLEDQKTETLLFEIQRVHDFVSPEHWREELELLGQFLGIYPSYPPV